MEFKEIIDLMDVATIIFSFFAMFFAAKNWWSNRKLNEKIPIFFNDKKLDLDITRRHFTRMEVQGILGVLRVDMTKNYQIKYLSQIEFLDDIFLVQQGKLDLLNINLTKEELKQFKI